MNPRKVPSSTFLSTHDGPVKIWYTNYRGEAGHRVIIPKRVYFGSTTYHQEPQWLLVADDVAKQAERIFAMRDITEWAVAL